MMLKTFCGCFSLRVGALIIGTLTVVWAALVKIAVSFQIDQIEINSYVPEEFRTVFKIIEIGVTTYAMFLGATGALMVHGARTSDPGFVFPWIARVTADLLVMPAIIVAFITVFPTRIPIEAFFIILAIIIVVVVLHVYIWLAIYSFYKQITVEKYGCAGFCSENKVPSEPLKDYQHV